MFHIPVFIISLILLILENSASKKESSIVQQVNDISFFFISIYLILVFSDFMLLDEFMFLIIAPLVSLITFNSIASSNIYVIRYVGYVNITLAIVLDMLNEYDSFFDLFLIIEVMLLISIYYIYSEQNLQDIIFLYFIPNIFASILFLVGMNSIFLEVGSLNIEEVLTYMEITYIESFVFQVCIFIFLISKIYTFPFSVFIVPLYNKITVTAISFFSLLYIIFIINLYEDLLVFLNEYSEMFFIILSIFTLLCNSIYAILSTNVKSIIANISVLNLNLVALLLLLGDDDISEFVVFMYYSYLLTNIPFYYFFNVYEITNFNMFISVIKGVNGYLFFVFFLSCFYLSGYPFGIFFLYKLNVFLYVSDNLIVIPILIYIFFSFLFFIKIIYLSIFVHHSHKKISNNYSFNNKILEDLSFFTLYVMVYVLCILTLLFLGGFFFSLGFIFPIL